MTSATRLARCNVLGRRTRLRSVRVKLQNVRRTLGRIGALVLAGALLMSMGGCPVNGDDVFTATVEAALNAASASFVDALSAYLAGT
jgi:hypothetical protein